MDTRTLVGKDASQLAQTITAFADAQRVRITSEGRASSVSSGGRIASNKRTDTLVEGHRQTTVDGREIVVSNVSEARFDLCMKHPSAFTALLPQLVEHFDVYASVRNPLAVLLSWADSGMPVTRGRVPAAERVDPELAARLNAIDGRLDRQIFILDYFFRRYREFTPNRTLRYEDVVASGGTELVRIHPRAAALAATLSSRNARATQRDNCRHIAERLLADRENACWHFYSTEEVAALAGL
jgi:hypothetical protein